MHTKLSPVVEDLHSNIVSNNLMHIINSGTRPVKCVKFSIVYMKY